MQYRSKLCFSFTLISFVSILIALSIAVVEVRSILFAELQSKLLSIATTTAASIDPTLLEKINSPKDQSSENYKELQQFLRNIRNANRREDIHIEYLYTVKPSPSNPSTPVFNVDAEENPDLFSPIGEVDPDALFHHLLEREALPFASKRIFKDRWGMWLTAYAPVWDKNHTYVATVAVDMGASDVYQTLQHLIFYQIPPLLISLSLATIVALFLSKKTSASLTLIREGIHKIGSGDLDTTLSLNLEEEFQEVASAINQMTKGLKERERLKSGFARYVSRHILERILHSETPTKLEGERKKVTVLFSDIRQFTSLSEKLAPEEVVSILNEYFEKMLEAVFSHNGTFDKFIGDGLMAEFGAPLPDDHQEKNALSAALCMLESLEALNQKWSNEGKPTLRIGIGIHTGLAVVGNIGTEERMEYTAIGDTVNVAARLEKETKEFQVPIILSETTRKGLDDTFTLENLGKLSLPGRNETISAFAVKGHTL